MPTPQVHGPAVRTLPRNEQGRDLIVGDVHGQHATFERLLAEVGYRAEAGDRILLLGDVIDRGPDSAAMLGWLQREGVFCVRGNHEQMMLDALEAEESEGFFGGHHGGGWTLALSSAQRDAWRQALRGMPLALEVDAAPGKVVLVHAEIPIETPWWALKAGLEEGDRPARIRVLWSRNRIRNLSGHDSGVPDVWRTFHGHVPIHAARHVGNMRWIDLGAGWAGWLESASIACVAIQPDGVELQPVVARVRVPDREQEM